ncbi:MAG: 50S ribosomal protein L21 [Candidatus Woesebacteria bacterium]|jgi:large subunit ribosomal protein L21
MKYAIIKVKGHQVKVKEGDELLIDKTDEKSLSPDVLLYVNNSKVKVGKPTLKQVKVTLKVVEPEVKGEKIHVTTYKAKSRYRRKKGFRPVFSKVKVGKIIDKK